MQKYKDRWRFTISLKRLLTAINDILTVFLRNRAFDKDEEIQSAILIVLRLHLLYSGTTHSAEIHR